MSDDADLVNLRSRVDTILRSPACHAIRFQIDNVRIQRFMYDYVAGAIRDQRIYLHIGSSPHYEHHWNDLTLDSATPDAFTIVHEATHAVIDATQADKIISTGTHEAVAYLAETVYVLNAGDSSHTLDVRGLGALLYPVARQIQAYNASHPSGLFTVPDVIAEQIRSVLQQSSLHRNMKHTEQMDGLGAGPRRGLIGRMILDQRSR